MVGYDGTTGQLPAFCPALIAAACVVERRIDHPEAQVGLEVFREIAQALGHGAVQVDALLTEVDEVYRQDRGRGLVAATFPELNIES